jgi:hypothetical protein
MDFNKKNDFVVKHQSKDHFQKDAELYSKTYPDRKLNKELEKASHFQHYHLDGRILLELLDGVSPEAILANRKGQKQQPQKEPKQEAKPKAEKQKEPKAAEKANDRLTAEEAEALLESKEVSALDYHKEMRAIIDALDIETKSKSKKAYAAALKEYKKKKEVSK